MELDVARNVAIKDVMRPVAQVAPEGTPGRTAYEYVVVARSRSKNVDRQSARVRTAIGAATLSETAANLVSWTVPPDTRDCLVFRSVSGSPAHLTGLVTPVALAPTVTSLRDTGLAVGAALSFEADDDLFHSADRFWHSSAARDVVRLTRVVPADGPGGGVP